MADNIIVLEDVQKSIDQYLTSEEADSGHLLNLITYIYIGENTDINVEFLGDDIKKIIQAICQLNETDIENLYSYVLKKMNDAELEMSCLLPYIPDDKTTAFTQKIKKYLKKKNTLEDSIYIDFMESRSEDIMLRFKAYYILFTFHHDQKNVSKCKYLVDNFKDDFSCFPLWHYTNSQIRYQEERDKDNPDMTEALVSAKKCIEIYKSDERYNSNYPGIYHNFCELVFYASELGDKESFQANLELAKEYIEVAKNINPKYAKYYYTQGRLLMAQCRYETPEVSSKIYDRAERLFNRAIDMEDSSRDGYAIKIVDYETALLRCKTERRLKDIDMALVEAKENQAKNIEIQKKTENLVKDSKTLKEELESQKKETLELLGFFSGIISLIVVTVQVVLNLDMVSAAVIMLLFLGTMILAFSFFHFVILNGTRQATRSIVLFIILGVVLVVGSLSIAIVSKYIGVSQNTNNYQQAESDQNVDVTE